MARSVLLLLSGAMAGSAAVYLLAATGPALTPTAAPSDGALAPQSAAPLAAVPTLPNVNESFASERLAIYALAAETTNPRDLEAMIRSVAAAQASRSRELRLTALLSRLAELDPRRALEVARGQYLESKFFVPLYETWARLDAEAAIAELAALRPPQLQRELALAVLGVIGHGEQAVAAVAARLPATARPAFAADALVARAQFDPAGALAAAVAMPSSVFQNDIMNRIAEMAIRADPQWALSLAAMIDDPAHSESFTFRVAQAWAQLDPQSAFDWFENSAPAALTQNSSLFITLAQSDPERAIAMMDRLPPNMRTLAQSVTTQALAQQNPEAAMAMLASMPLGQERDRLISAVGQALAQQDPEQALVWARNLDPPSQQAISSVMQGMMQSNPDRAVDLLLNDLEQLGPSGLSASMSSISMLLAFGRNGDVDIGRILDRLAAADHPSISSMLPSVIGNWASSDAEAALNWALAHPEQLNASAFQNIAQRAADADLGVALGLLDRVPREQRAGWVAGLARRLVQSDPQQAMNLLEQQRGQANYGAAYLAVARELSRFDPMAAARMLTTSGSGLAANDLANTASNVVAEWAGRDPAAAARWVGTLERSPMQARAMSALTQRWAITDADQARQWLLGQARGAERDDALRTYLSVVASSRGLESDILGAFSSEQAAQQSLLFAISQVGRNDVEEARRLMNAHVTDPALRRTLEETLTRTGGSGGSNAIVTSGGIILF